MDIKLKDVVLVDGLFLAINKNSLKEQFDETVEGFHMYDVNFCYKNFVSGVKIGVTTLIRVNHQSIGMTNQQWEDNRIKFSELYKDSLPVSLKKELRMAKKMWSFLGQLEQENQLQQLG